MTMLLDRRIHSLHATEPVRPTGHGLQVVMADDDRRDQQMMLYALDRARVDATMAFHDDGSWLIHHLSLLEIDMLPDLIVLDLNMPFLDGFRVLDELQGDRVLWQIPVLVLTATVDANDRQRALSSGASFFEVKPHDLDGLVQLAKTFPERARNGRYENPLNPGEIAWMLGHHRRIPFE